MTNFLRKIPRNSFYRRGTFFAFQRAFRHSNPHEEEGAGFLGGLILQRVRGRRKMIYTVLTVCFKHANLILKGRCFLFQPIKELFGFIIE